MGKLGKRPFPERVECRSEQAVLPLPLGFSPD